MSTDTHRHLPGFPRPGEGTAHRRYLDDLIAGRVPDPEVVRRFALPPGLDWEPGLLRSRVHFGPDSTLAVGVVFGGYLACLTDHFAGLAMLTVMPDTSRFLTAELTMAFRAPLVPGTCAVEAEVVKLSPRRAVVEVRYLQDGRVASRGECEQIILRRPAPFTGPAQEPSALPAQALASNAGVTDER